MNFVIFSIESHDLLISFFQINLEPDIVFTELMIPLFNAYLEILCMHYLRVVIILFNTDFYKSDFSICSFKIIVSFVFLCFLSVLF